MFVITENIMKRPVYELIRMAQELRSSGLLRSEYW